MVIRALSPLTALLAVTATLLAAAPAAARSRGIAAAGCEGCHGGQTGGQLSLTANPAVINPGQRVELTLSIIGGFAAGGAYIHTNDVGTIEAIPNQGMSGTSGGLVHNQPKLASGGTVDFRFAWTAPSTPGNVRFEVYALGANNNKNSSGDSGIDGKFDFVYGCSPKEYFLDGDGDGVGRDDFKMIGCDNAPPPSYVEKSGDCDDYRKTTYPGAPELCNMIDDDCDGEVDEDAIPVELWPDADGDGYYDARTEKVGTPMIGCAGLKGWAAEPGDCRPMDPTINAGQTEVCNGIDDDCDGDVDERVRPVCGEGWCRREAPSCDPAQCVPGEPEKETCNFLDDDCDGEIDEDDDMCDGGRICVAGACVDPGSIVIDQPSQPSQPGTAGGGNSGAPVKPGGPVSESASGCALGPATSHGALAAVALLSSMALWRRRRRP